MKRKMFWFGYFLAIAIVVWLYWQRRQQESPAPAAKPPAPVPPTLPRSREASPDPLQEIAGIGPVYARRLQESGIRTFRELASLSADEVRAKAGLEEWQGDVDSWIAQAQARIS